MTENDYIFHLHPEKGSAMETFLLSSRDICEERWNADDSWLYPPHVSMSGWVHTDEQTIQTIARRLQKMLQAKLNTNHYTADSEEQNVASPSSDRVNFSPRGSNPQIAHLGRILTTETGYVLHDLSSRFLYQLMLAIDEETHEVKIKGKPINHITLANNRMDASIRDDIMEMYTQQFRRFVTEPSKTRWEIVVYQMVKRTPKGQVEKLGPHGLKLVARVPVWRCDAGFDPCSNADLLNNGVDTTARRLSSGAARGSQSPKRGLSAGGAQSPNKRSRSPQTKVFG